MESEHVVNLSEKELREAIIGYIENRGELVPASASVQVHSQHVMRAESNMNTTKMVSVRWGAQ